MFFGVPCMGGEQTNECPTPSAEDDLDLPPRHHLTPYFTTSLTHETDYKYKIGMNGGSETRYYSELFPHMISQRRSQKPYLMSLACRQEVKRVGTFAMVSLPPAC